MPIVTRNDPYRCPPWWRRPTMCSRTELEHRRCLRRTPAQVMDRNLNFWTTHRSSAVMTAWDLRARLQIRLEHQPSAAIPMWEIIAGSWRLAVKRRLAKVSWAKRPIRPAPRTRRETTQHHPQRQFPAKRRMRQRPSWHQTKRMLFGLPEAKSCPTIRRRSTC